MGISSTPAAQRFSTTMGVGSPASQDLDRSMDVFVRWFTCCPRPCYGCAHPKRALMVSRCGCVSWTWAGRRLTFGPRAHLVYVVSARLWASLCEQPGVVHQHAGLRRYCRLLSGRMWHAKPSSVTCHCHWGLVVFATGVEALCLSFCRGGILFLEPQAGGQAWRFRNYHNHR